jgi:hypothetical protein
MYNVEQGLHAVAERPPDDAANKSGLFVQIEAESRTLGDEVHPRRMPLTNNAFVQ